MPSSGFRFDELLNLNLKWRFRFREIQHFAECVRTLNLGQVVGNVAAISDVTPAPCRAF
jgi:hypothetical protein